MSITVATPLLEATTTEALRPYRDMAAQWGADVHRTVAIDLSSLDGDALDDVLRGARTVNDTKTLRALESVRRARQGLFDKPVPNFAAFEEVLREFLIHDLIDGWVYVAGDDGRLYPELVSDIRTEDGRSQRHAVQPYVTMQTLRYGYDADRAGHGRLAVHSRQHAFSAKDVVNRRVGDVLSASGIYKETVALKAAHEESMDRHRRVTQNAFGRQFRLDGGVYAFENDRYLRRGERLDRRRVIHDTEASNYGVFRRHAESTVVPRTPDHDGVLEVPEHPLLRVFDLKRHEFMWVHGDHLTPYVYDKTLRDKLVLPESHRDLLDVLTTDLDRFAGDMIEGKSAGNVILCKGIPGVGKTLTAEVYAELIERPLYTIHSGSLGTSAVEIEENLQKVFLRAKRWSCVLLLDEADVFVVARGSNIEQNAIVAEFLRALEYFSGLLFLTTNRPNDIDDAIVPRCAAIIEYTAPNRADTATIWRVMARQQGQPLDDALIDGLVDLFPGIAPRDIKMLFRLALRVAQHHGDPLTLDLFRRCAMFRAITMNEAEPSRTEG